MKSIKYNLIMNILKLVMTIIFPLITFPYASRILMPDGIGKVSFFQSVASYFMILAMLGIPTYGIRECAKVRDDRRKLSKTVKELLVINLFMMVFAYLGMIVSVFFVEKFQQDTTLLLVCSISVVLNACGMDWLFQAIELYKYITIRSFIFKLIGLVLMLIYVKTSEDYVIYALITVISSYGSNILNLFYARKFVDFRKIKDKMDLKRHIKPILVLFSITAAASIYMNLDTVMLGFMKNDSEVGFYSTAIKVKTLTLSFVTALGTVILPRTSYYLENNMIKQYYRTLKNAFDYVKIMAIPLAIFFMITAKNCVIILAGNEYVPSVPAMIAIMPVLFFSGFSNIIGMQFFVAKGKEIYLMKAAIIGAVVDLLFNCILIPSMAATGAALATTITELVVLLVEIYYLYKMGQANVLRLSWEKVFVASILAFIGTYIIKIILTTNIIMEFIILGTVFFSIYILVLLILKETLVNTLLHQVRYRICKRRNMQND